MTNAEYFKNTLTDKELADMYSFSIWDYNKRLADAVDKWAEEHPAIMKNRSENVAVQLFLSKKFNKKYWEKA